MSAESTPPSRARSFRLRREESVGDGLRRLAAERAESAIERLGGGAGEAPAEAIHGARKDIKKLRAVLRLSREDLGRELFREENRRFRDAARLLAASRDAEVKLTTLAALRERGGAQMPRAAVAVWAEALERERDAIAECGDAPVAIGEAIAALAAGCERIEAWPLDGSSWPLLRSGLRRSYRDGRRGWRRAAEDPSAAATHEWRKRAKDLWYQLRILAPAWPGLLDPAAEQVHAITDQLGAHHDLALLAGDLAARQWVDPADRGELTVAIARRQAELFGAALASGERLYAERPKAFGRRLGAYWAAWRG